MQMPAVATFLAPLAGGLVLFLAERHRLRRTAGAHRRRSVLAMAFVGAVMSLFYALHSTHDHNPGAAGNPDPGRVIFRLD